MIEPIRFTILGQPASKANSRELAMVGAAERKRMLFIKSKEAREYERNALKQIPPAARQRLEGPVKVAMRIYYKTELPDMDEQLVLDCLQDRFTRDKTSGQRVLIQNGVYRNDRQVRKRYCEHAIDRHNPRTDILIIALAPQQGIVDLFTALEEEERAAAEAF